MMVSLWPDSLFRAYAGECPPVRGVRKSLPHRAVATRNSQAQRRKSLSAQGLYESVRRLGHVKSGKIGHHAVAGQIFRSATTGTTGHHGNQVGTRGTLDRACRADGGR